MIPRFTRRSLLAGAAAGGCGGSRKGGYRGHAYIALEGSRAVAAVDLTAFSVRFRVPLSISPSELLTSPEAGLLFAVSHGQPAVQPVDPVQRSARPQIDLPGIPVRAHFDNGGKVLWVATRERAALVAVDTQAFRVARTIALPEEPLDFDVAQESDQAAVLLKNRTVERIELVKGTRGAPIAVDEDPGALRIRKDGRQILVTERAARRLAIFDYESGRPVVHLPLPLRPDHVCMKPDGGQMFLTGEGQDAVVLVYPYRTEVAQTSLTGRGPGAMGVCESPDFLFVANPMAGSVTIFNLATQRVVAVTAVGREPDVIEVTPDRQYALVLNRASGDMAVIRIGAIQPGRAKSAPLFTMVPVGETPAAVVVRSS